MNDHLQRLQGLLALYPRLRPLLARVCERLNRREAPTGTIRLGENLDRVQEVEPLRLVFDTDAVTQSRHGIVAVHLDRIAAAADSATVEAFLAALHAAADVPRENRPAQRRDAERETDILLARLRLQFPGVSPLHNALARRRAYWLRRTTETSASAVQGLLTQAFGVVEYLERHQEPLTFADLGARVCGDSKAFRDGELRTVVGDFLVQLDAPDFAPDAAAREEAWRRRNVVSNPTAIRVTVFGPIVYWKHGQEFDWIARLWECEETATLSWGNIKGIEHLQLRAESAGLNFSVITCENETPFCHLVRQREPGVIVYTEGYPNAAVLQLLRLLQPLGLPCRHWGDSDLDGLRIAAMLHGVHPLTLWRCDRQELLRHRARMRPLMPDRRDTASRFLREHRDFQFAPDLAFTIDNGWLEQEAWSPT